LFETDLPLFCPNLAKSGRFVQSVFQCPCGKPPAQSGGASPGPAHIPSLCPQQAGNKGQFAT
jgi:hypothetical protein